MRNTFTHDRTTSQPGTESRRADAVRGVGTAVAAAFLLVGIAGFIPGLTTNVGELQFAGPAQGHAHAELLGLFHVSWLHNIVHIAFGLIGLGLARTARGASGFLVGGGLLYAVVLAYGLLVDRDSEANFLPVNVADNWLHGGLALAMIVLGSALAPHTAKHTTPS